MKWNELKKNAIAHGFRYYKGLNGHDLYINEETKKSHHVGETLVTGSKKRNNEQT